MADTSGEIKITQNRIVKFKSDRASNQGRIGEHLQKAKEAADEAAKFVADAANGDRKARENYDRAKGTETLHREQARLLQNDDRKFDSQLSAEQSKLNRLLVKEKQEALIGDTGKFHAIATELSNAIAAPAAKCADLKKAVERNIRGRAATPRRSSTLHGA